VPAAPLLLASALVAATPLASDTFVPFVPPSGGGGVIDQATGTAMGPVETFDPVARAELLARQLPRQWSGTYQAFSAGAPVPVVLNLTGVRAMGAIVDLRGEISIDGVVSPVQGNLSAESDQLDLILLGERIGGGLEPGGEFQGLQGLELSGWNANRLTDQGGRLALKPGAAARATAPTGGQGMPIRGLW
jgi:hypothetical protein